MYYSYAVFFSPTYRRRYAEQLRSGFPRVLLPRRPALFRELALRGERLAERHLLREATFPASGSDRVPRGHGSHRSEMAASWSVHGVPLVDRGFPKYQSERISIARDVWLGPVPAEIWGRDGYGGLTGLMATPVLLARAAGRVERAGADVLLLGVYVSLLGLLVFLRAGWPSIFWEHDYAHVGSEKLFNFSLIQAFLHGQGYPPENLWLAGEPVDYYALLHALPGLVAWAWRVLTGDPAAVDVLFVFSDAFLLLLGSFALSAWSVALLSSGDNGLSRRQSLGLGLGLGLGVLALVVTLALLEGFQSSIRAELVARATHARVVPAEGRRLVDPTRLASVLHDMAPSVEMVQVVRGTCLVSSATDAVPASVSGRSDVLEVGIDSILAGRLMVGVGEEIQVVAPRQRMTPMGPLPVRAAKAIPFGPSHWTVHSMGYPCIRLVSQYVPEF